LSQTGITGYGHAVHERIPVQNGSWVELDVTSIVNNAIANEEDTVAVIISPSYSTAEVLGCPGCEILNFTATDEVVFSSSEHATVAQRPHLRITTSTAAAVIDVSPNDLCTYTGVCDAQVSVSPSKLTFTHENWFETQTVTVTAIDDNVDEGIHNATLTHTVTSNNIDFNGGGVQSTGTPFTPGVNVTASVTDNDRATVVLSTSSVDVTEAVANASYTVKLSSKPISTVTVTVTGNSQAYGSPSTLTFTPSDWQSTQEVTVVAVDDTVSENLHSATHAGGLLTHAVSSDDENYNTASATCYNVTQQQCNADRSACYPVMLEQCYSGASFYPSSNVYVTVSDNDAGVTLSKSDVFVAETGADDSYTIVLNAKPTADVTVSIGHSADILASPSAVVFTVQIGRCPSKLPCLL
jgi:hypothetical protein